MRYNQYRSKRLDLLLGGKLATALFCAVILLTSAASSSAQPRWREFATLRYARHAHAVCRLGDDSLIVIGGYNGSFGLLDGYPIERTEIIDLKTGSVSDGPIMVRGRAEFATVTLPDGDILVFGGYVWSGGVFNGIERLDVQTLTWSQVGKMINSRRQHSAVLLNPDSVLIVGTFDGTSAEIFNISTGTSTALPRLPVTFTGATLVPVEGRTPTFFGFAQGAALFPRTHSIRFNFEKMVWEQDLRFTSTTQAPRAIPLADGSAFVAGGARRQSPLQGSTNTWKVSPDGDVTNAPGLLTGRVLHEMGLWSKNCVLVAGGMLDSSKITGSCEWVDLERGVTTQAPSLNNPRAAFKLAVVPMRDGRTRAFAVSGVRPDGQNTNSIEVLEDSACETRSEPVATSSMRLVGSAQNDGSAIQLTADESNRSGAAFIRDRVLVRNGFELSFSFRLTKGNDGSNTDGGDPGADGLAVVFLPGGPSALSTAAGGLGYDGIGHGMAVEFDAFRDTSALDPNGSHVAVQIGNGRTLSARHEAPFMRAITAEGGPSLRADGTLYFGRISLSGNHLSVSISESTTFGDPVIVISDFDISRALGLDERGSCFIGFTASTGASFQQHTLVSVNLQNCEPLFVNVDEQTPEIENVAFSVTPNPASATALVKFTAPLPMNSTMSISDVHGRLVWRQDIAAGATSTSIDSLAELPSGTYVVLLPVGSGVLTQTLCIVR